MRNRPVVLLTALILVAAACGGETADTSTTTTLPEGSFRGADGVVTVVEDTSRIVVLNGDITEIIFEFGLGDRIVGVDVTTTYPPEADDLPRVGVRQRLAAEPVLALDPTLVIGDELVFPPEAIQQIRDAGVPVVILKTQTTFSGLRTKILEVAAILGVPEKGTALADRVDAEIDEALALVPDGVPEPRVLFVYARGVETRLIFGRGMVTKALIEGAGGIDGGSDVGVMGTDDLTPEAVVAAAPDVIITVDDALAVIGGVAGLKSLPGVGETPAARNDRIYSYDPALFLGFSQRAAEALTALIHDLYPDPSP
jgi:iron complex transport system substrate-binding protein